jgi:signal transduction histidine kinase
MADDNGPERDPVEHRAIDADAALVRGVRWRLVAWSALTTFLVLLVLGVALYAIVERSLAAAGTAQLEARADDIHTAIARGGPGRAALGQIFGGRASGTIAMLVDEDGRSVLRGAPALLEGLPERNAIAAVADGPAGDAARDIRTGTIEGTAGAVPVRVLTEKLDTTAPPLYLQVVQDRVAEQQTLDAMLAVLLVGGAVVVLVALGFGAVYARRALVPIRDSLAAQRTALRRQRAFAADASHELRTPLTVVRSSIEHLRRNPEARIREQAEAFDDIDAEVTHLGTLVEDLLLLARSDSGALALTPMPTDLGDVATEAASALSKAASERGVRLVADPEPAVVRADAARLRQLVTILVDNAIRHSPRHGEVRVLVRNEGGRATLQVEDDGPGIPEGQMPLVFERFWRAPGAPSGGTGLGLAIARTIVEQHGGSIMVANGPTGGARFRAVLPLAEAPAES